MRKILLLNDAWLFTQPGKSPVPVNVPHTWNVQDGQDGGSNYLRCTCVYEKNFPMPDFDPESETVYLEFDGVNASAKVELNGNEVCRHHGGYSTFRVEISGYLAGENHLTVTVDNTKNTTVYPQKADFTFYGGIYRDVSLLVVNKEHFSLDYFGGSGLEVTAVPDEVNCAKGKIHVAAWHNAMNDSDVTVKLALLDAEDQTVATGSGIDTTLTILNVRLWNGLKDPYLYTAAAQLVRGGQAVDEVRTRFGVRSIRFDAKYGFFLNGQPYPLHGVSRHQDHKDLGNALTDAEHRRDMELIREVGANSIRLAHYQHSQYFYDLCDEYGMVVWAEIPYISEHMPDGLANTVSQMKELVIQNYNHPSIVTWGISNEITISTKNHRDMMDNHRKLNYLVHQLDPTRPTSLACYACCLPFDPVVHKVSDMVGYNLYLGWYVPGAWLNDVFLWLFHLIWPNRPLCYSEYGAEGMPNLHSTKPHRGDHTEEYQAIYHEFMLKCFARHPWMWATYVWNMFDFASDARDQGGEPGMNHKGLITFDRKTKKDSFYLYKAYWSEEAFVHICGKRYTDRSESAVTVKVYSNQSHVAFYANGKLVGEQTGGKIFNFILPLDALESEITLKAEAGRCSDTAIIRRVNKPNPSYKLQKNKSTSANWV